MHSPVNLDKQKKTRNISKDSKDKVKQISEGVDKKFYIALDRRKTPPKNKEILNSVEKIDKRYYESVN